MPVPSIASLFGFTFLAHLRNLLSLVSLGAPRLVNFVPAIAYYFCLSLPAGFSQPGARLKCTPQIVYRVVICPRGVYPISRSALLCYPFSILQTTTRLLIYPKRYLPYICIIYTRSMIYKGRFIRVDMPIY